MITHRIFCMKILVIHLAIYANATKNFPPTQELYYFESDVMWSRLLYYWKRIDKLVVVVVVVWLYHHVPGCVV